MDPSIGKLDSTGLLNLVKTRELDELEAFRCSGLPFCTAQIAQLIASNHRILGPHRVRELLAGFPGINSARALEFIGTLPWGSLLGPLSSSEGLSGDQTTGRAQDADDVDIDDSRRKDGARPARPPGAFPRH